MSKHGRVIHRDSCPQCGSTDNVAVYEDGYRKCFTPECSYYRYEDGEDIPTNMQHTGNNMALLDIDENRILDLNDRGIGIATALDFNYMQTEVHGVKSHVAPYYDKDSQLVAQKVRQANKKFFQLGNPSKSMPFGFHLWKSSHKSVVLVEGEIDAMSVYQVYGNQIAVAGMPNGAGKQTAYYLKENLRIFDRFDTIYIGFDKDDAGHTATKAAAELFSDKQIKVVTWKHKDPNDSLILGKPREITEALSQAKDPLEENIYHISDISLEKYAEFFEPGVEIPLFPKLREHLREFRSGGIYTVVASPGVGKTTFLKTLALELIKQKFKVGAIYLEDDLLDVVLGFQGLERGESVWSLKGKGTRDPNFIKELHNSLEDFKERGLYLFDSGNLYTADSLLSTMNFLVKSKDCKILILDNMSMILKQLGSDLRSANQYISKLVQFCKTNRIVLFNVTHRVKNVDDHIVKASDVQGTNSYAEVAEALIGIECDPNNNSRKLKILKNRTTGYVGYCDGISFDIKTGRIKSTAILDI